MTVQDRRDGVYLSVETPEEGDLSAQGLVDRELDRVFFLTCVRVQAEMCRRRVIATQAGSWSVHTRLPLGIQPLAWSPELALQLRLWSIAVDVADPCAQLLLYFQIVELVYPQSSHYPRYCDASIAPDSRTEAKLLRHLVAHAGLANNSETKKYLQYLGLGLQLSDRTKPEFLRTISDKVPLVREEARKAIVEVGRRS